MSEWTPTTQQVEAGFSHEPEYEYLDPINYASYVRASRRAFRRWLVEVERAAAEKALTDLAAHIEETAKRTGNTFTEHVLARHGAAGMIREYAAYRSKNAKEETDD